MSDTSPRNQAALLWNAKRAPAPVSRPGEELFEFLRGHDRFLCELRDHGKWGIEAQFFQNEEFLYSRRFDDVGLGLTPRELAIQWAESERTALLEHARHLAE